MTQIEMGLKLNKVVMMLDETNFRNVKGLLQEIVDGVNELYDKPNIRELLIKLEDNMDMRTMSVAQAEGYCRALEDVKKVVGK